MSVTAVLRSITASELEQALDNPVLIEGLLNGEGSSQSTEDSCYLEKTQDAIHFLLTGDPWPTESPLSSAIFGGEETGFLLPAGPVMYLAPEQVRAVGAELSSIPNDEIARRYSPERLSEAEIYPNIWHDDPGALASVQADYDSLVAFYDRAAAQGMAVLIHLG